jgi:type IV secretory pathway VirB3-like protein
LSCRKSCEIVCFLTRTSEICRTTDTHNSEHKQACFSSILSLPFLHTIHRPPLFLGAFAKLLRGNISFVMSVRLSSHNKSAPIVQIFMKLYIREFFENLSRRIQVSLNSDKNNGYFTRRTRYIYKISH